MLKSRGESECAEEAGTDCGRLWCKAFGLFRGNEESLQEQADVMLEVRCLSCLASEARL